MALVWWRWCGNVPRPGELWGLRQLRPAPYTHGWARSGVRSLGSCRAPHAAHEDLHAAPGSLHAVEGADLAGRHLSLMLLAQTPQLTCGCTWPAAACILLREGGLAVRDPLLRLALDA